MIKISGKCSWFGGPLDHGVDPDEGLAFIYSVDEAPHLFLATQPAGTSGLARRLNPFVNYIACRWNYDETSVEKLLTTMAIVHSPKTKKTIRAFPADWGPHVDTGRIADLSQGAMRRLGITTDDTVNVSFPDGEELTS